MMILNTEGAEDYLIIPKLDEVVNTNTTIYSDTISLERSSVILSENRGISLFKTKPNARKKLLGLFLTGNSEINYKFFSCLDTVVEYIKNYMNTYKIDFENCMTFIMTFNNILFSEKVNNTQKQEAGFLREFVNLVYIDDSIMPHILLTQSMLPQALAIKLYDIRSIYSSIFNILNFDKLNLGLAISLVDKICILEEKENVGTFITVSMINNFFKTYIEHLVLDDIIVIDEKEAFIEDLTTFLVRYFNNKKFALKKQDLYLKDLYNDIISHILYCSENPKDEIAENSYYNIKLNKDDLSVLFDIFEEKFGYELK